MSLKDLNEQNLASIDIIQQYDESAIHESVKESKIIQGTLNNLKTNQFLKELQLSAKGNTAFSRKSKIQQNAIPEYDKFINRRQIVGSI